MITRTFTKTENSNVPLYLFHQGTNYRAYEYMGMHRVQQDGRTQMVCRVWAPNAQMVSVVGEFNNWDDSVNPMEKSTFPKRFDALSLPDGCSDPVIINLNISDMMPAAAADGDHLSELQALAEDTVGPALERIGGVAAVDIFGGVGQQVAVQLDPTRAAGYGLSNAGRRHSWPRKICSTPAATCKTAPRP